MHTRRHALSASAKLALLLLGAGVLPAAAQAQAAGFNQAAFDAKSLADVMKALGANAPLASADVSVSAPDIAENGAVVPVGASSTLPGVKRLMVLVEKNPSALSAIFDVSEMVDANFSTRVKMGQSSDVYAVALMNDGRVLFAKKEVKVTLGGCGLSLPQDIFGNKETNMADPMRIRAQAAGDKATVRVLMAHEMETGQRKDAAGKVIPAWYIQQVNAKLNGKDVLSAQWGPAVAKNPFLQFMIKGAKAGDKVSVTWVDNRGDTRTDEALVT